MPSAARPAPVVLVATPDDAGDVGFGSYAAVAEQGRRLLAAELSQRLGAMGAAIVPLPTTATAPGESFRWGRWFVGAGRALLDRRGDQVDAIGYAGAGALALAADDALDALLSAVSGEVVANNRFSADAFVVAGDLSRALAALEETDSDNGAPRHLEAAGFDVRDLGDAAFARFDVDTPIDLALLRLATRLASARAIDASVTAFLEMARLPGDRRLEVPSLEAIGQVVRSRTGELVVAGRVPASTWAYLETETACRIRCFIEERGMRSARDGRPRSLLARLLERSSPQELIVELAALGDAVVLDTRVLMAAIAGSSDAAAWPPAEERYASDLLDASRIATPWLRELTEAAATASVPFILGGHALVSDGLRLIVDAAWQGR